MAFDAHRSLEAAFGVMENIRVYICDAHCTGKTTIVNDVSESYQITKMPEVARRVFTEKFSKQDLNYKENPSRFKALQLEILREQERAMSQIGSTDVIMDRCIDPIIYALYFLGKDDAEDVIESKEANVCLNRCKAKSTVLFVVDPHEELLTDDGVRMSPKMKDLIGFTKAMKVFLTNNNVMFHTISVKDRTERVHFVVKKIRDIKTDIRSVQ